MRTIRHKSRRHHELSGNGEYDELQERNHDETAVVLSMGAESEGQIAADIEALVESVLSNFS